MDTGLSHFFVVEDFAKRAKLKVEKTDNMLKALNTEETLSCNVAKDVEITTRDRRERQR